MAETFKCPSCSAPLDFEGNPMQKCRFCGSNVIVPQNVMRDSPAFGGVGVMDFGDLSALTGKALKIAEIQSLLNQRRKIEAIKVFRETFGTGLAEAKNAVDRMERGESIDLTGMTVQTSKQRVAILSTADQIKAAKTVGWTIGGSVLGIIVVSFLGVGAIIALVFFVTLRSTENVFKEPVSVRATPENPSKPLPESSIATELLRFGGEGNGAGKFDDNRTVAVDAEGRIYSASRTGGRIQVFDAEGKFQTQISANAGSSIDKLLVDRKGTLVVLQGYDIVRFNRETGELLGKTRVNSASDAALGLDGRIYVANRFGTITVLGSDGAVVKTIAPAKEIGIERIEKLAVDGDGNLFVFDIKSGAVFKLGPDAKLLNRFSVNSSSSGVSRPTFTAHALAVDSAGRLYVAQVSRIAIFDRSGAFLNEFKTEQTLGLAIDENDNVLTASRPFVVKYKVAL